QNCVNKSRWGVARPDDMHMEGAIPGIKFALGENPRQVNFGGGGFGGGGSSRYPASRMGVETLIRDRFTAAKEYAAQWTAWNQVEQLGKEATSKLEVQKMLGADVVSVEVRT